MIFQKLEGHAPLELDEKKIEILTPEKHPKEENKIAGVIETTKQKQYRQTYQNMFRPELNDKTYPIVQKMDNNGLKLQRILVASWGARGSPIKDFEFDKKISDACRKLVKGKNINRYYLDYSGKWLLYENLYRPALSQHPG